MEPLKRAHLILALVATIALTCQPASALTSTADPTAAPGKASAVSDAEQPLPTAVPSANDEFANAEIVGSLPFTTTVSTLEATAAPDDPTCFGNTGSVWYAYTPPISTTLAADTFGSDYNTILAAYTGPQGSLTEVACNDDAAGLQSQIVFPAVGGQTYYLMAAGLSDSGSLTFNLDASAFPQIGVRTTAAQEALPSADADHFAWSQATRRSPRWALYVQPSGEPRVRVNRPRTEGYSGGFEGETFVYQEVRNRQHSDLQLYHLVGGGRSAPPAGVNTRYWEWHPTISGDWLLFGRRSWGARADFVLLRNLVTGETRRLARLRWGRRTIAEPGQVSGNYAVWYRCTPACDVLLYDIAAATTTRIPNPNRRQQYDPSVTSDGTVYFVRSGRGCGTSVRLVRHPLGGPSKVLAPLGAGRDSGHSYALENDDGTTTVFFDRVHCSTNAWDVFKVVDP